MAATQTITVYNALKEKIISGVLSPAESLPEAELAAQHGVSRNTIKKALLMLESEGFVTIEQNKGAKVRAYSKREVIEYLEVREALEGLLIRQTVPVITEKEIASLEDCLAQMRRNKAEENLLEYSQNNRRFHQILYDACPNRTMAELIINLKNQLRKYNSKTILIPGRSGQGLAEHTEILNALKEREVHKAEQAMCRHIRGVRQVFEQYFDLLF